MKYKMINIVYFSGTGGTERIAGHFADAFTKRGIEVNIIQLNSEKDYTEKACDLLIVLYAVHAFNAPKPVDEWIDEAPIVNGTPAVIISVSGGGDVSPNTACRVRTIKNLKKKGYEVIYDKMMVMPSNWITLVNEKIAQMLLRAAPIKADRLVSDILSGKIHITKPKLIDRLFSSIGTMEKMAGKKFGQKIIVHDQCTGCSACSKNCPRGNITMKDGKPAMGERCIICLRCFYLCPQKALEPGILKFFVIKDGYDLNAVEKMEQTDINLESVDIWAKGIQWNGLRAYLKEDAFAIHKKGGDFFDNNTESS